MAGPPDTYSVITSAKDCHQTCVKMCLRDMGTATENHRCRWKIFLKKFKKNCIGWHPP